MPRRASTRSEASFRSSRKRKNFAGNHRGMAPSYAAVLCDRPSRPRSGRRAVRVRKPRKDVPPNSSPRRAQHAVRVLGRIRSDEEVRDARPLPGTAVNWRTTSPRPIRQQTAERKRITGEVYRNRKSRSTKHSVAVPRSAVPTSNKIGFFGPKP